MNPSPAAKRLAQYLENSYPEHQKIFYLHPDDIALIRRERNDSHPQTWVGSLRGITELRPSPVQPRFFLEDEGEKESGGVLNDW